MLSTAAKKGVSFVSGWICSRSSLLLLVCVAVPLLAYPFQGNLPKKREPLDYHINLDRNHELRLHWSNLYTKETVLFEISTAFKDSALDHWILFGFSDYGEASNADLVIYWTDGTDRHHFQDAHTDSSGILHIDKEQNYELFDVRRQENDVSMLFARHFDTCDSDDYHIDDGTTHIIFFWGPGKLSSVEGANISKLDLGLQRAQLLKPVLPKPKMPSDARTFEILHNRVHLPAQETTYWCSTHTIPLLTTKHHIVRFEPAIQRENEGVVHHMEVFHCEVPTGTTMPYYNGECSAMTKPKQLEACKKVIGAWAMGAEAFSYPEEAGSPIGGKGFSPYVMLEVHYNNVEKRAGIVDSSGLKFTFTSQLRPHDAGCMELGLEYTDKTSIPPEQDEFFVSGYCVPQCTSVGVPPDGIKIFASQLHSHLTGRAMWTSHTRHGVQLSDLNHDHHYSPHFQEIRMLPRPVHVLPGDSLTTVCKYRTRGRVNVTMGGFAISDEMCVNYIHYYPRIDLEVCKSSVDTDTLTTYLKYMKLRHGANTSPKKTYKENYSAINWNARNVNTLQQLYDIGPLSEQCNRSNGDRFPGYWNGILPPVTTMPLPKRTDRCDPDRN